ncbi:AMP-binding protein [Natrinema sp. HArc-T2]|uniref:AMP-binding protein n=1 Tax=Natrinema sp. HArc-T2 TaxID=3242701 RepID=UPI00359E8771
MGVSDVTLSLARWAEQFPNRTAVVDISERRLHVPAETINEDRVSYEELSTIAMRTTERLSALDVGPGETVCLVTRNRIVSLALFFACRRLGATFAPISHLLTPASVTRPFETLEPDLVVFEAAQRDLVRSIPFDRSVTLEELAGTDRESFDADEQGTAATPALALHGGAGQPVAGYTAETIERNCTTSVSVWGLAANDVVPLTTPLSTPESLVRVALSVLSVGGTLLLDRAFTPDDVVTAIDDEGATLLPGREAVLRDIAAEPGFDAAAESLERVLCDAPVAADVVAAYRDRDVPVARVYGRLECPTALSQRFDVDRAGADGDGTGVGRPVPNCRARLVDREGSVLEGDATGRLELAGPVVSDGYVTESAAFDRDESADTDDHSRFVDGWFHTGDRVHRDANGTYHLR